MRTRINLDADWRFALGDFPDASGPAFDDSAWRTLDLPHDWSIEATPHPDNPAGAAGGFFPGGIGWYRKRLDIPSDLGDRRVLIEFDGVYMNSEVWCNGRSLGVRPYGYSSFCYDLTPCVTAGQPAVIAVRVDNARQRNSRWYSGSGIYRHVWLTLAGPVRVAHWGTFVTTPDVSAGRAVVACQVTVVNESGENVEISAECRVPNDPNAECGMRNAEGNAAGTGGRNPPKAGFARNPTCSDGISCRRLLAPVPAPTGYNPVATSHRLVQKILAKTCMIPGKESNAPADKGAGECAREFLLSSTVSCSIPNTEHRILNTSFQLPAPQLWSPDAPHLYTLCVELKVNGAVVDRHETRFGIRSIRFDAAEGFFLNGEPLKFRGVNEHHDAGCLGAAVPDDEIRRRFRILKAMGCNAIRVAHNPASPAFLDLCDEMGFLVVEDAFDEWKDGKTPFGYGQYWDAWWERDLTDMIRRDRNHPCIVMWSVGNEIKEVREGRPEGLPIMKALREVCHREDSTRPMTCGCCNSRETLAAGYGPLMDVFGYNGGGGGCFDFEKDHARFPGMFMFASEHPHTLQTRGVYRTRSWYRDLARNRENVLWHGSDRMRNAAGTRGSDPATTGRKNPTRRSRVGTGVGDPPSSSCAKAAVGRPPLELMEIPHLTDAELFPHFDEHYQSSYGNAVVRMSIFDSWSRTRRLPYFCGEFRWTGFDYLGECYAWPCKSWNFGIIDLCGFPKDAYYFYQSQWTTAPMVHLVPHWTWPGMEGKVIPVIGYTNCDRVELFLDDESLGVRERDDETLCLRWDVPYRPGTLKAVGYRMPSAECRMPNAGCGLPAVALAKAGMRNGTPNAECRVPNADAAGTGGSDPATTGRRSVDASRLRRAGSSRVDTGLGDPLATCVHTTAGEPAAIRLRCEEATLRADGICLAHVVITVVDAEGRFVPHACPEVTVDVIGPATLIGLENGDPLDTTNYKLNHRRAFNGMLLAIVRAGQAAGTVRIAARAEGLRNAECRVRNAE